MASLMSCMIGLCVVESPKCEGLNFLYCNRVILCKGCGGGGLVWEDTDADCKEGGWSVLAGFDGFL